MVLALDEIDRRLDLGAVLGLAASSCTRGRAAADFEPDALGRKRVFKQMQLVGKLKTRFVRAVSQAEDLINAIYDGS